MRTILVRIVMMVGSLTLFVSPVLTPQAEAASAKAAPRPAAKLMAATKPAPPPPPKLHVVAEGDSLSAIAESEQLESWRPLWNANTDLQDPNLIYAGQQLIVPTSTVADRPLPASALPPVQAYSGQARRSGATANYAAGAPGLLERIRMRESGGNYATNTGNGYYGAYQFTLGTWQGVGGAGLPSEASPAEQDMRAQLLYERRGCSPWPNTCY